MNITIPNRDFLLFYDRLWDKFSIEEIKNETIKLTKKGDIWRIKERDGTYRTQILFGANWNYFSKLRSNAKGKKGTVLVNPDIILKALIYLDVKPKSLKEFNKVNSVQLKVKYLMDLLIEEILKVNLGRYLGEECTDLSSLPEFEICFKLITDFYKFIGEENFLEAWGKFHPQAHKEIFKGDFELFKRHFITFPSISSLSVHDLTLKIKTVQFNIHFHQINAIYDLVRLQKLSNSPKQENGVFANIIVKSIEKILSNLSFKSLKELNKTQLENFKFQNYLWTSIPTSIHLKQIFPKPKLVTRFFAASLTFQFISKKWYITSCDNYNLNWYNPPADFSKNYTPPKKFTSKEFSEFFRKK